MEKRLAEYVGVKHCISCANGTDALTLVMMAWDIKAGDAVFVPDFTFATGEIVSFRGATPIFVDVDRKTFNMDPVKLERAIQKISEEGKLTPKAIIPVDLFGLPADYMEIERIAQKYGLLVLEDGAQGFGGSINGKMACSFGDAAATSFSRRNHSVVMAMAEQFLLMMTRLLNCLVLIRFMGKVKTNMIMSELVLTQGWIQFRLLF